MIKLGLTVLSYKYDKLDTTQLKRDVYISDDDLLKYDLLLTNHDPVEKLKELDISFDDMIWLMSYIKSDKHL